MSSFTFTLYARAQPQGSNMIVNRGKFAVITSANLKMKPFRSELTRLALWEMAEQGVEMFAKHVPLKLTVDFTFRKPASVSKKRTHCVVKPDLDKLLRCVNDSLTGAVFHDDAQVVEMIGHKHYGDIESVVVSVDEVASYFEGVR